MAFPCLNEEANIHSVLLEWNRGLSKKRCLFELLVIDNNSQDQTCALVEQLRSKHRHVRLIRNPRNLGYSGSCMQAFRHARGRWVIFVDGDGQYRSNDGLKVLKALKEKGFSLVLGHRTRRADPILRKLTAAVFWVFFRVFSGISVCDPNVGLRGWDSRQVWLCKYLAPKKPFANVQLLCALKDRKAVLGEVSISHLSRGGGTSFYQYHRLPGIFFELLAFLFQWRLRPS